MSKSKLSSLFMALAATVDNWLNSVINPVVETDASSEVKTPEVKKEESSLGEEILDIVEEVAEAVAPEPISDIIHAVAPIAEDLLDKVMGSEITPEPIAEPAATAEGTN